MDEECPFHRARSMTARIFGARAALIMFPQIPMIIFGMSLQAWAETSNSQLSQPAQSSSSRVIRAAPQRVKRASQEALANRVGRKRRQGQEGSDEAKLDAEQARELYIRRKRRLEQIQAQQQELSRDKKLLATNRARMQARLIDTARSLRLSEKRLSDIEERLVQTRANIKEQREKLNDKSDQMSALLILLQGMSRQPPPIMITHSRDALNMIRSGMVLATFYEDVEKLARQLHAELAVLEATQREAEKQEQRRRAEQVLNSRLKTQVDLLLVENREQLESTTSDLESLKSVAKIHMASLKSLEDVLPSLDDEVSRRSGLGAYEAELKHGTAEISPDVSKVALLQPGRMKPSIPFSRARGLLPLPVQGKLLVKFADPLEDGVTSKGLHIETRPGAQVISPCDGWIVYAGPFRSYGQLLIINPGGGYHVVIAGMDRVEAITGQFVLAGEPIAAMGSEPRASEKTPARPNLYVEFRRDQQPIDPAPWWSAAVGRG
jgi:septal ring factor EnvC (AmiA/AmiB activator)